MELGLILFLGAIGLWMYFTTPRFREMVFGYLLLLSVISLIISLLTGIFPNSHYEP